MWGVLGAGVTAGVAVVILVSTGWWSTFSGLFGVGDPDVSTPSLQTKEPFPQSGSTGSAASGAASTGSASPQPDANQSTAQPDAGSSAGASDASSTTDYTKALAALDSVRVAKARPGGYDRARYFGGWASNGCGEATTRDTILARDMRDVRKDSKCRVASGTLSDPYTGRTISFRRGRATSSAVQVDHVVALLDAWESGARDWDQARRVKYANSPDVLLASDGPANMAKGAGLDANGTSLYREQKSGAPDIWMPDDKAYRCDYMARRAAIKAEWGLSMTAREKQQATTVLAQCAAGTYDK